MKDQVNVADLPYSTFRAVASFIDCGDSWDKLQEQVAHFTSNAKFSESSRAENLLYLLGHCGQTVKDLLCLLDKARIIEPQLILRRKFKAVTIIRQTEDQISLPCQSEVNLFCEATGFPYPIYQWLENGSPIEGANGSKMTLKLQCGVNERTFRCLVTNAVPKNEQWYEFYAKNSSVKSSCESHLILVQLKCDRTPEEHEQTSRCECCDGAEKMMKLKLGYSIKENPILKDARSSLHSMRSISLNQNDCSVAMTTQLEPLLAADKVALIVSNAEYQHLPRLATPTCDGQTLTESLLNCDFKTVTLSDLNAREMRSIVREYCKLLGAGVYALFYFVGHGFEAAGQCYLLPVDAPAQSYTGHDCLCAEEVLAMMQETDPALNVILLDVCRKLPSTEDVSLLKHKVFKPKVNRNTVFGYATSFGEGAYEVRGEENGIFMKHFKKHVETKKPITDIFSLTMRDLERDAKAADVQFPEIRTNLTRPRSLKDETDFSGHSQTFECRTIKWQEVHELPDPIKVQIDSLNLLVMIWFDFCGNFVNMVYAFTTVYFISRHSTGSENSEEIVQNDEAKKYLAYLQFPEHIETNIPVVCKEEEDDGPRISVRLLVKHLQRYKENLHCQLDVRVKESNLSAIPPIQIELDKILVMKLQM